MLKKKENSIWSILVICFIVCLSFSSCTISPPETPEPPPVGVAPPIYGLVYAYPAYAWEIDDRAAMHENFDRIKAMGIETVIQAFPSSLIGSEKEENLLIFLDAAQEADIDVIACLWPSIEHENNSIDYQTITSFLSIINDHPALLAYLGFHEPLERFTNDQLHEFYTSVKDIAPNLPIAHYMGNIAGFDHNIRFPNRDFSAGICDICLVWHYPAKYKGDLDVFEKEEYRQYLRDNRELLEERAPNSQIWVLGQAFSLTDPEHNLRMPTPQEMQEIFVIAYQEQVDGFLWYPWLHDSYDSILSEIEMQEQQNAVGRIYQDYISPGILLSNDP